MIKFIINIILAFFLLLTPFFVSAYESSAQYAILYDYNLKKTIYSKNGTMPMAPSSMSKLMSLYVIFNELRDGHLKLDDLILVSDGASKMEGSRMFIESGQKVTVQDLLRGIIIQSGNDACIALAEHISGSEKAFVQLMNDHALSLNLENSHFANATGLPDPNHHMSAHDLAVLSATLIKEFAQYYPMFSEKEFTFNNITQANRNLELGGEDGVDGIKTGHTNIAGYGIVMSALKGEGSNHRLIAVVNGLPTERARSDEAKALLAHGFNNFDYSKIATANVSLTKIDVFNGQESKVDVVSLDDLGLMLPKTSTQNVVTVVIKRPKILIAPVENHQEVGKLIIYVDGDLYSEHQLVASKAIPASSYLARLFNNAYYQIKNLEFNS